ncbi:undecaprenyl-diphosphate phosphatase [Silvimonas sp. JCM 19000]
MSTTVESILFAIMQGVSELFPVSSLGHGVIVPELLHWQLDRQSPQFLPFMVVLHLGTALALLWYFRHDWIALFADFLRGGGRPSHPAARPLWLVAVATIPAGVLGLVLEKKIRLLFGNSSIVLAFLMLNGFVLIAGDAFSRRRQRGRALESLSFWQAFKIGIAQSLALIPGLSRSGTTLIGGLSQGLDYAAAARFSFLLATPVILAAGLHEVPLLWREAGQLPLGLIFACGVLSGVCAYISTWALMKYFNTHEVKALRPFGYYCIAVGVIGLVLKLA